MSDNSLNFNFNLPSSSKVENDCALYALAEEEEIPLTVAVSFVLLGYDSH